MIDDLMFVLVPLLRTLLLEGALALIWGVHTRRDWLLILLGNILNNIVVLIIYPFWPGLKRLILLECGAIITEALIYHRWGQDTKPALLFSLCANCFSYCASVIWLYVS